MGIKHNDLVHRSIDLGTVKARKDELLGLARSTFITNVPEGQKRRPDIVFHAGKTITALAIKGGEDYRKTLQALKWAWSSEEDYATAVRAVVLGK